VYRVGLAQSFHVCFYFSFFLCTFVRYTFIKNSNNNTQSPIALKSLGPMNSDARQFLSDLGRRISRSSDDDRETSFLFQRISVLLFRKFHNNLDGTK